MTMKFNRPWSGQFSHYSSSIIFPLKPYHGDTSSANIRSVSATFLSFFWKNVHDGSIYGSGGVRWWCNYLALGCSGKYFSLFCVKLKNSLLTEMFLGGGRGGRGWKSSFAIFFLSIVLSILPPQNNCTKTPCSLLEKSQGGPKGWEISWEKFPVQPHDKDIQGGGFWVATKAEGAMRGEKENP